MMSKWSGLRGLAHVECTGHFEAPRQMYLKRSPAEAAVKGDSKKFVGRNSNYYRLQMLCSDMETENGLNAATPMIRACGAGSSLVLRDLLSSPKVWP